MGQSKGVILFQSGFCSGGEGPALEFDLGKGQRRERAPTVTSLPPFSPPYGYYSLIARSQALRRSFVEGCGWEAAAPAVKDPDRVADPSTLRRWFRSLDSSHPPFSYLRRTMLAIGVWLRTTENLAHDSLPLRWHTTFPFLAQFWPLRV